MSYKPLPYTYGAKTTAEINALGSPLQLRRGDTVFNTDSQMIEIWSGRLWVDERSIEFKIKSTTAAVLGNLMKTDTTGLIDLCGDEAVDRVKFCGVIVAITGQDGEGKGGFASVAHAGKVKALAAVSVQSGQWATVYTLSGTPDVKGRFNDITNPGTGCIGLVMESVSAGNLGTIALQTIELG